MPRSKSLDQRFDELVVVGAREDDCWAWKGQHNKDGYATLTADKKAWLAHRASYQLHAGELVPGLTIDHICKNRGCSNPRHLRQVGRDKNVRGPELNWPRIDTTPEVPVGIVAGLLEQFVLESQRSL